MNIVVYYRNQCLLYILARKDVDKTMLTEWMITNQIFDNVRDLTFAEFSNKWV